MSLTLEHRYPWYLGAIAFFSWLAFDFSMPENSDNILNATLTISAILTGFLATAKSIIIGLDRDVIADIKSSGYMVDFVSYIKIGIWLNLALSFYSMGGYFFSECPLPSLYGAMWFFLVVSSALSFIRVVNIFLKVLVR